VKIFRRSRRVSILVERMCKTVPFQLPVLKKHSLCYRVEENLQEKYLILSEKRKYSHEENIHYVIRTKEIATKHINYVIGMIEISKKNIHYVIGIKEIATKTLIMVSE